MLILLIILSIFIVVLILDIFSLIIKLNKLHQELNEYILHNKTLTTLNDNIRTFKHDFNNIIQSLGGYISTEDITGLKKYYYKLLADCQISSTLDVLNPEFINDPAIYNLITSKYYKATEFGIRFNIDIFLDLSSLNMNIYEFTRILGILLDNAIEAASECEYKEMSLVIKEDSKNSRQLVIVSNTYKDKNIDTEKIYEKGYSSKPHNTGLGLWKVHQILKSNDNLNLYTSKDNMFFTQQLELYKKECIS